MGIEGFEPSRLFEPADFKSAMSTIPSHPLLKI